MKLGFMQAGMPDWSHDELIDQATRYGFDGVAVGRKNFAAGQTSSADLAEIRKRYAAANVEIHNLGLHSRPTFPNVGSDEFDWDEITAELVPIARMASELGCPSITVMVQRPSPGYKWDWIQYLDDLGQASLNAVKEVQGVRAVFQNHVGSASARNLLEMVERLADQRLGVGFSPDHCIVMQEDAVELARQHAQAIQYVCMADRKVVEAGLGDFDGRYYYVRYECCVVGEGVLPIGKVLYALAENGFDGYATLKWEKSDVGTGPHLPNGYGHHLPRGEFVLAGYADLMRSFGVGKQRS